MRTTPIRLAACTTLLGVSLAGCTSGTDTPGGPASATVPAAVETTSATPEPSAGGSSGIPAGALLQPADIYDAKPEPLPEGEFPYLRPLRPCGDERYPSDSSREDAVAVRYNPEPTGGDAPVVVTEFVGRHAPGGAAKQYQEIGAALKRCPGGLGEGQRRWKILGTPNAGDQSVLVRIDTKESYGDEKQETVSRYAALARVGDVIVVVADLGWENIGGSEKLVRELIGKAVQRAGTIG